MVGLVGGFVMMAAYDPDPKGVRNVLDYWPSLVWASFMGTSWVAAVATWWGRWRVEYVVLPLFGIALLVAISVAWIAVWGDPIDWQKGARAASATALLFLLISRYVNLRRLIRAVKAHEPWTLF